MPDPFKRLPLVPEKGSWPAGEFEGVQRAASVQGGWAGRPKRGTPWVAGVKTVANRKPAAEVPRNRADISATGAGTGRRLIRMQLRLHRRPDNAHNSGPKQALQSRGQLQCALAFRSIG